MREYHRYQKEVPDFDPANSAARLRSRTIALSGCCPRWPMLSPMNCWQRWLTSALDPDAADEVVSSWGGRATRARAPIWAFFQANRRDLERLDGSAHFVVPSWVMSACPYPCANHSRRAITKKVANAATAMIAVGGMEDIPLLRTVHRQFKADTEIRVGVANAILSILGETDQATLEREMDDIQGSLADCE